MSKKNIIFLLIVICTSARSDETIKDLHNDISKVESTSHRQENTQVTKKKIDYKLLNKKITFQKATLQEVKQALTNKEIGELTNTIHALYSMRWNNNVINLLDDMWKMNIAQHPELPWELIKKNPIKLAIASTINRIKTNNTDEYKKYIYSHKEDKHEFNRAQVIIALALNGNSNDVEYLEKMADSENHYIIQTAITGLGIMSSEKAKNALGILWKKHRENSRGKLIEEVLDYAYKVEPSLQKPGENNF